MTIDNWKAGKGGKRLGMFDLTMPSGIQFLGCTVVEGKDGKFIGLPQRSYEVNGETKYVPTVKIPDEDRKAKFDTAVLAALEAGGFLRDSRPAAMVDTW